MWLCNDCAADLCIDELFSGEYREDRRLKMDNTCYIYVTDEGYECANCGQIHSEMPLNYCTYCGAAVDDIIDDREKNQFTRMYRMAMKWGDDHSDVGRDVYLLIEYLDNLKSLIDHMYSVLQHVCREADECCILWPDHKKQCMLRDIEDKMRKLGFEVDG